MLDEDHFDLEKVKERIIEYLAVAKLKNDVSGPILCFVGPPGVGKTSLGQSIARALGREFVRISVGGVHDESEIRGHRRTYIGAMPGTIIRALRDAESTNPVFLLDEIDKMGADFRGDPASAMLEVLDPEQNSTFRDHYLDLPFDLSKVLFICTANRSRRSRRRCSTGWTCSSSPATPRTRSSGSRKRYLVPKQLEAHGLTRRAGRVHRGGAAHDDPRVHAGGGRPDLERQIAALCRKAATQVAEGKTETIARRRAPRARAGSGRARFSRRGAQADADPGVATGLAVTAVGGDVLFIEATAYPGHGPLDVTGQLGEVMQESAQAALSWVRSHAEQLGHRPEWFARHDIHVHVPAGAVPKDGPSAGITMVDRDRLARHAAVRSPTTSR